MKTRRVSAYSRSSLLFGVSGFLAMGPGCGPPGLGQPWTVKTFLLADGESLDREGLMDAWQDYSSAFLSCRRVTLTAEVKLARDIN